MPRFSSSTVFGPSCCVAETCTHSANCADDRRDSPGAARGEVPQTQFIVRCEQRQVPTGFQFLDKVICEPCQVLAGVQCIDKVVGVLGVAYGGFRKNSCVFYVKWTRILRSILPAQFAL